MTRFIEVYDVDKKKFIILNTSNIVCVKQGKKGTLITLNINKQNIGVDFNINDLSIISCTKSYNDMLVLLDARQYGRD